MDVDFRNTGVLLRISGVATGPIFNSLVIQNELPDVRVLFKKQTRMTDLHKQLSFLNLYYYYYHHYSAAYCVKGGRDRLSWRPASSRSQTAMD